MFCSFVRDFEVSRRLLTLQDLTASLSTRHPWVRRNYVRDIGLKDNFVTGARSLIGVQDVKMYPVRGQTILVHAPHLNHFLTETEGMCDYDD